MKKKYLLVPGMVQSKTDGEWHYIDAPTLANLYHVPLHECIIHDNSVPHQGLPSGLLILRPLSNGRYYKVT